jgi:hypothetical protein
MPPIAIAARFQTARSCPSEYGLFVALRALVAS